ncbi:transposase, partial [Lactobacillus crispatus]
QQVSSGSSPKCWCKLNSANLLFHKFKLTGFF